MWLFFGIVAIITAFCNWGCVAFDENPAYFRFISMASTALTACGFNQLTTNWALYGDFGAILDTAGVADALWVLVVASIVINGVTLLVKEH